MNKYRDLPPYVYEPLKTFDHVRVVVLQPSVHSNADLKVDIIQCDRLQMRSASSTFPIYEAVSYTWGDPKLSCRLICNETRQLMITKNVDTMLRYFRRDGTRRYFWIDAICLDQKNEHEKLEQISRMGSIYRQAKKVRIWLGEECTRTFGLFRLFDAIGIFQNDHEGVDTFQCSNRRGDRKLRRHLRHNPGEITLTNQILEQHFGGAQAISSKDFNELFERPWFGRRWILQEAVLNRHTIVHCGEFKIPWLTLTSGATVALQWFLNHESQVYRHALSSTAQESVKVIERLMERPSDLLALLWDFHNSECQEPSDRLKAMYGLATSKWRDVDVDVATSSAPWTTLFEYLARASMAVENQREEQIMMHVLAFGPLSEVSSFLPSFVPNWSGPRRYPNLFKSWADIEGNFSSWRNTIYGAHFETRRPLMRGNIYTSVGKVWPLAFVHKPEHASDWRQVWQPIVRILEFWKPQKQQARSISHKYWHRFGKQKIPSQPARDPRIEVLKTLCDADIAESLNPEDSAPFVYREPMSFIGDFSHLLSWMTEPNHLRDDLCDSEWPFWIVQCLHNLYNVLSTHSLLVVDEVERGSTVESKVAAWGPPTTEHGDEVARYNGPFLRNPSVSLGIVLRPVPLPEETNDDDRKIDSTKCYKIIGPCFLLEKQSVVDIDRFPNWTGYSKTSVVQVS